MPRKVLGLGEDRYLKKALLQAWTLILAFVIPCSAFANPVSLNFIGKDQKQKKLFEEPIYEYLEFWKAAGISAPESLRFYFQPSERAEPKQLFGENFTSSVNQKLDGMADAVSPRSFLRFWKEIVRSFPPVFMPEDGFPSEDQIQTTMDNFQKNLPQIRDYLHSEQSLSEAFKRDNGVFIPRGSEGHGGIVIGKATQSLEGRNYDLSLIFHEIGHALDTEILFLAGIKPDDYNFMLEQSGNRVPFRVIESIADSFSLIYLGTEEFNPSAPEYRRRNYQNAEDLLKIEYTHGLFVRFILNLAKGDRNRAASVYVESLKATAKDRLEIMDDKTKTPKQLETESLRFIVNEICRPESPIDAVSECKKILESIE